MIRTLQRELYTKAKQVPSTVTRSMIEHRCDILSRASKHRAGKCACLGVKNIGKPCAGKLHVRFDEGGQLRWTKVRLLRHRQTKGAATDRPCLRNAETALYSTRISGRLSREDVNV